MSLDQHAAWEEIAASFDSSRTRTWAHVDQFLGRLEPCRVLDLMAGNGRHTPSALAHGHEVVGLDWSRPLTRFAAAQGATSVAGDATQLPFVDDSFDACMYVAGLHGLPTSQGRLASLAELRRVLRPGGRAQITVWSRAAPRFADEGTPGEPVDVIIPWKKDGHDVQRTYHLYTLQALQNDCKQAGFAVLDACEVNIVSPSTPDNLVIEVQA